MTPVIIITGIQAIPVMVSICFQNNGFSYSSISILVSKNNMTTTYMSKLNNMDMDMSQCHFITVTRTFKNSHRTRHVNEIEISLLNLLSLIKNTLIMIIQLPCYTDFNT